MNMDDYVTTDTGTGIYGYLNLETNEIDYVGQTSISFRQRDRIHKRKKQNVCVPFDYKLQAHPDKYIMIPLVYCDDVDSLDLLETFYIYYFNTIDKYNYTWGGDTLRGKWHPSFRNDLDDEEIKKLYIKEGLTTVQIGERFGVSYNTINKRLKEQGVKVSRNTSNYYRVSKSKAKGTKQGFIWQYQYFENNKKRTISSINFETLKKRVQEKGLPWYKIHNR